jgi:hypothetical protein
MDCLLVDAWWERGSIAPVGVPVGLLRPRVHPRVYKTHRWRVQMLYSTRHGLRARVRVCYFLAGTGFMKPIPAGFVPVAIPTYVFTCAFPLVTRKFCEFGYPGSLWVWVVIKSAIIRPPI